MQFKMIPLAAAVRYYLGESAKLSPFVGAGVSVFLVEDVNPIRFLGQQVVEKHPTVKEWTLPSPATVDLDGLRPATRAYRPLKEMELTSGYPDFLC